MKICNVNFRGQPRRRCEQRGQNAAADGKAKRQLHGSRQETAEHDATSAAAAAAAAFTNLQLATLTTRSHPFGA